MMRSIIFCMLLVATAGCVSTKTTKTMQTELNGTWIPIQEEIGGNALPSESFKTQKLEIHDSTYTFTAESVDKGIAKYNDGKMDIYGKDGVNAGKHFTAIYKIENDRLSICYNLTGTNYPESFDTKGKPLYFLCVFTKQKQ